jgi:hypothetical protein
MALSALRLLHFAVYGLLSLMGVLPFVYIACGVAIIPSNVFSIYTAPMVLLQLQLVVALMTGSI